MGPFVVAYKSVIDGSWFFLSAHTLEESAISEAIKRSANWPGLVYLLMDATFRPLHYFKGQTQWRPEDGL